MSQPDIRTQVVAQLSVRRGRAAIAFYEQAFGAVVEYQVGGTDAHEEVVAQLAIEGSTFWVADESPGHANFSPESVGGGTVRLLLMVGDPAAAVERALPPAPRSSSPSSRPTAGCSGGSPTRSATTGRSAGRWWPGRRRAAAPATRPSGRGDGASVDARRGVVGTGVSPRLDVATAQPRRPLRSAVSAGHPGQAPRQS